MNEDGDHLLLVGGGHAHVAVLADWIRCGLPCARASLLTPDAYLRYSGTVPGWIAGHYSRDEGLVDLAGLAARAGAKWVSGRCAAIDPESRTVTTDAGELVSFDIASIDTGGVGRARDVLGNDPRVLDIRPIGGFVDRLEQLPMARNIAVVGGGAGGTELAFALRNRKGISSPANVTFVTGQQGLLPDHSREVRSMAAKSLESQDIRVIAENAQIKSGALMAGDHSLEPVDLIVAALGSAAPGWPRAGGLECDEHGFIAVDKHQRSVSHRSIFAVGDVAARQDINVPHSGVHAVFAGPALAANLKAAIAGKEPQRVYRQRWNNLYLMSTGDGAAIASYGTLAAHGRWVSLLKHTIDMRWLGKYARLAREK